MAGGRPSKYSMELVTDICRRIAEGQSLRKICAGPGMVHIDTVREWLLQKPEFSAQYARAREEQADLLADECIEIADDKSQDILDIKEGGDTRMITNSAAVQRAKLQVDARKWKAGQLAPKKWGQQNIKTELTGTDGKDLIINLNLNLKKVPGANG